jgi:hypothetical protein
MSNKNTAIILDDGTSQVKKKSSEPVRGNTYVTKPQKKFEQKLTGY